MSDETEKQVLANTIDISILKNTSAETLRGVNKICDTLDKDRVQNQRSFDNIDSLLRGKDSENPGLIVKVDRLESFSKRVKGGFASLVTAMVAIAATVLSWILGVFGAKG